MAASLIVISGFCLVAYLCTLIVFYALKRKQKQVLPKENKDEKVDSVKSDKPVA